MLQYIQFIFKHFFIFVLIGIGFLKIVTFAHATEYYVATDGSNSFDGLTLGTAFASFDHALNQMSPGDTMLIADGTYHQALHINKSGEPGAQLTIKVINDGQVIIDGEFSRNVIYVRANEGRLHDIVIEGIVAKNGYTGVVYVYDADRVVLRRISAYDVGLGGNLNNHVVHIINSSNVLVEDCVASGRGRDLFEAYDSSFVTFRRCWGRYVENPDPNRGPHGMQVYGTSDSIVENCIFTSVPGVDYLPLWVWANLDQQADRNKLFGNIVIDAPLNPYRIATTHQHITDNQWENNVALHPGDSIGQNADGNMVADRFTVIGAGYVMRDVDYGLAKDADFSISVELTNSIFAYGALGMWHEATDYPSSFSHSYNNVFDKSIPYYGLVTADETEFAVDPGYEVDTYGDGAYLFIPSTSPLKTAGSDGGQIGAEVLYRYQDGVLTDQSLWPWPMEERIMAETGISVTWEENGGLWKTLDGIYSIEPVSCAFDYQADEKVDVNDLWFFIIYSR